MSVVSLTTTKSHEDLAGDLQLQLFEQAAAAKLIARLLDEVMTRGSELKPDDILEGLVTVANGIARTCSEAAESMSTFQATAKDRSKGARRARQRRNDRTEARDARNRF